MSETEFSVTGSGSTGTMSFELERGSTLGKYELLVRVGRGGMASVWVARGYAVPGEPEQLVAVKAMLPDLASNMEFRSMFLDEGQIVGSIDHPNVVRVYDVGETNGILYMAMEWVEGDSLHTLIAEANKRRPIPSEVAVRLIADAAAGLHAAHELRGWDGNLREIVHCDVSPHNILIGLDGKVKLVDFGVAGAMNQINNEDDIKIRGKFGYMSPEQAQAKPLDRRSDVFSLGIVLFELTTGYRLFRGRDDRHTLELVTWGKIPKPSQVLTDYPERLERIVTRALERDPRNRFQTADEFRDALETYLVEERILVPAAGVKGLLRRVLGGKIDQRRQQVRAAIRALDGTQSGVGLVSEEPVMMLTDEEAVSVVGEEPLREASVSQPQDVLGAAFLPGDGSGSSGVQTLSQPAGPPASPNKFLLLGAGLGIVLAACAFFLFGGRGTSPQVHENGPPASGTQPSRVDPPATATIASGAIGAVPTAAGDVPPVSIDSLPEDQAALAAAHPSAQPSGAHAIDPARVARDIAAIRADKPVEPPKVTLQEDPPPSDRVSNIANSVTLDDHGTAAGQNPESDIDRGAAQAALGRAAGQVASCRRPDGPVGPGRVLVTVASSGNVDSVTLQGKLAGTSVGECIANQFRSIRVPAFSGPAVTLARGFVLAP
jgi:hypothetical protein